MSSLDEVLALPLVQPDPEKLRGPELGARVRYTGTGRRHGMVGEVIERSYVWAPDTRYGDTRGIVRYDDSVVRFDDGVTLAIDDHQLAGVEPDITVTMPRADWEDIIGGMERAAADAEHAATLPDYEPDEQDELRQDAIDFRRIGAAVEVMIR